MIDHILFSRLCSLQDPNAILEYLPVVILLRTKIVPLYFFSQARFQDRFRKGNSGGVIFLLSQTTWPATKLPGWIGITRCQCIFIEATKRFFFSSLQAAEGCVCQKDSFSLTSSTLDSFQQTREISNLESSVHKK